MRTLKKSLALVLVLVMVVGLFAINAAAFTDDEEITYDVAVGVMSGIGAINGYEDGTFRPQGDITRAEAAKMLTYAILGPKAAQSLPVKTSSFTDMTGYGWAVPYVEYLVSRGIINGVGGGKFEPAGKVTGYQLVKMILCAAGYGKNGEYVGSSWAIQVSIDGWNNKVFTGVDADYNEPATREEAAALIYNGLTRVNKVVWNKTNETYDLTIAGGETIAKAVYGYDPNATVVTGMITGTTVNSRGEVLVSLGGVPTTYVYEPELAMYGHTLKLHTDGTSKVYYVEDLSTTYTVNAATVSTATDLYKALGYVVTWANATQVPQFTNYTYTNDYTTGSATVSDTQVAALNGITIVLYNGQITAVINQPTVSLRHVTSVVTTLGSESITLSGMAALSNTKGNDMVIEYAGIAKGDVVLATALSGGVYRLEKVTPVVGVLTAKTVSGGKTTYTVGGNVYEASTVADNTSLGLIAPNSMAVGKEYKLYLDAAGKIIAAQGPAATVSNYAYVAQFGKDVSTDALGNPKNALVADIYFADGTNGVYTIDVTTAGTAFTGDSFDTATETTKDNKVGLYDVQIAGGKAVVKSITAVDTDIAASGTNNVDLDEISITKGIAKIGQDADNAFKILYADANSIIFHVTGTYGTNTFKVVPVKGIANFQTGATLKEGYYKTTANGYAVLTAAVSETAIAPSVTPDIVFYAGKYVENTTIEDGKLVVTRTYTVYKNGVEATVSYVASTDGVPTPDYTGKTATGFYTTGAADITAYVDSPAGSDVLSEKTVVDFFGGALTLSGGAVVQVTDATVIVDLTTNKSFVSLDEDGKTITVYLDITTSTTGIKTADVIYVTSIS